MVTALLDILDGSVAILSGTTSQLGDTLDHVILDPLVAWLALMAARQDIETVGIYRVITFTLCQIAQMLRTAVPEWDLLWLIAILNYFKELFYFDGFIY